MIEINPTKHNARIGSPLLSTSVEVMSSKVPRNSRVEFPFADGDDTFGIFGKVVLALQNFLAEFLIKWDFSFCCHDSCTKIQKDFGRTFHD